MTHPDNLPDELDVPIRSLSGVEGIANTMIGAGCAISRKTGSGLTVYVPNDYDDDDVMALCNDVIHAGYVITRPYTMPESDEFQLKLEMIPVMSSAYRDIVIEELEGDDE